MPVPLEFRSRRNVPSPLKVSTVTVYVVPLPETLASDPLPVPVDVTAKSDASTPVTAALNVTV